MQNIPAGLIPYNHEKYLTGKYIAETRGGFRPDEVVYLKGSKGQELIYVDDSKYIAMCWVNGCYHLGNRFGSNYALFLRPKTVKKWHPVFTGWSRETEEECIQSWGMSNRFLKAVEVEVNED